MEPGPELDAFIDTKIMGFEHMTFEQAPHHEPYPPTRVGFKRVPKYSTEIAAAWTVVEKLRLSGLMIVLVNPWHDGGIWMCEFRTEEKEYKSEADTPALAICLAALKAVGYDKA